VIYSLTGMKVETLEDLKKPLEFARGLLPPHVKGKNHLPYLGPLLDAGMAAIFSYEIMEALRLSERSGFLPSGRRPGHRCR
jgi:acetyl-CoA synthase